jgi:hypothetical protein
MTKESSKRFGWNKGELVVTKPPPKAKPKPAKKG